MIEKRDDNRKDAIPDLKQVSDDDLILLFSLPDRRDEAFKAIVERYQQRVYILVRRMVIDHDDTSDLVQITFIRVFHGLAAFRSDAQLFTWIYRIATNECLSFLKKKRRRFMIPIADVEYELTQKLESSPLINPDLIQLKLQKAILTLPEKQRIVFNLRHFDAMPYEQMSQVLGTSVGALKASYHFAVQKIKRILSQD